MNQPYSAEKVPHDPNTIMKTPTITGIGEKINFRAPLITVIFSREQGSPAHKTAV